MNMRISDGFGRIRSRLSRARDQAPLESEDRPDATRRMLLAGGAALIVSGVLVGLPTPAEAQSGNRHGRRRSRGRHNRRRSRGGHGRRRSSGHNRRRSSRHGRRRSYGHGRRRSRSRGDDCFFFEPFGWICF